MTDKVRPCELMGIVHENGQQVFQINDFFFDKETHRHRLLNFIAEKINEVGYDNILKGRLGRNDV